MSLLSAPFDLMRAGLRVPGWAVGQLSRALRATVAETPAPPAPDSAAPVAPEAAAPQAPARQAPPKDIGDADLTNKVSSIILRGMRGPAKGAIDINVVDGVVFLRGEVRTPQRINALEEKARAIPEVRDVQNLLHLPHTPAPTRTDTPPSQRHTRRKKTPPEAPRREPRRLNADKTIAQGEPLPTQLAAEHEGRPPSPLGSSDDGEPTGEQG